MMDDDEMFERALSNFQYENKEDKDSLLEKALSEHQYCDPSYGKQSIQQSGCQMLDKTNEPQCNPYKKSSSQVVSPARINLASTFQLETTTVLTFQQDVNMINAPTDKDSHTTIAVLTKPLTNSTWEVQTAILPTPPIPTMIPT